MRVIEKRARKISLAGKNLRPIISKENRINVKLLNSIRIC